MTHETLFDLLSQYEQLGFMQAVKAYEPAQDLIRETEVKPWLKMMKVDCKLFKGLVERGAIKTFRKNGAPNSPRYYSKKDIKSALSANNVSVIIRNSELFNIK